MKFRLYIMIFLFYILLFNGIFLLSYSSTVKSQTTVTSDFNEKKMPISTVMGKGSIITIRIDKESIDQGRLAFEKLCQKCHDAYSDRFMRGPGLKEVLKRDELPVSEKTANPDNILNQLNNPLKRMPSFHFIPKEMQLNILAFLNTL